jgi:hypothetical protein
VFLQLTEDYVASKFYRYCGKPSYNRAQKVYQGSCPICHEGSSWLKKRRCYYIVAKKSICCHNCGWFSNPYNWIQRVAGLTFLDIKKEIEEDSFPEIIHKAAFKKEVKNKGETETLPSDSINLFNPEQIEYYRNNNVIQACLKTIRERKLDTAVNRPFAIYTTLSDRVHLNRLIIPFIDYDNKIIWYQSRKVLDNDDRPKYLSKVNSERALFGANSVDENYNYIFITEGPIDAMFIKNGVGVAGINEGDKCFTNLQERQFLNFPLHEKIWVLDNQFLDSTSKQKTKRLLDNGERVFLWPESLSKYKDLNDYCCDKNVNCIDPNIILENSYKGLKGKLLASK